MLNIFREGVRNLTDVLPTVIGRGDFGELENLGSLPDDKFRFPPALWTRIVYNYALAYHKRKLPLEHLLKSLTPLYLGKTASFVAEVRDKSQNDAETEIEQLCLEFEANKDHLVNNWN